MRADRQSVVNHPPAQMGCTAYEAGYKVGLLGITIKANPHPYGSIPWVYYRRGQAAGLAAGGWREIATIRLR